MKKIFVFLKVIILLIIIILNLISCNNKNEYTIEELLKIKEKNKIKINNKKIKDNLEWIIPEEKPFNKIDNKYYYVVWRCDDKKNNENNNWCLTKFNNNIFNINTKLSELKNYNLILCTINTINYNYISLVVSNVFNKIKNNIENAYIWKKNSYFFKSVYRWNSLYIKEPNLYLDKNNNIKVI